MIDFTKKMKTVSNTKSDNPIDIYNNLDRTSVAGPLRASQESVLIEWYSERRNSKDIIIKLHTGEGKTLIGLLILLTKMNTGEGPCVYICPNKYLVEQVIKDAAKFGIPICMIGDNNQLPNEFLAGKKILVTHVQKMFNGRTIFGTGNMSTKVGAIVLDDAHACLDAIRDAFVISIRRDKNKELFEAIMTLFEDDLVGQGEGTYLDIKSNVDYESMLMVPYWAWIDKKSQVLQILAAQEDERCISFVWPLIKDSLENCQAFINGSELQIMPLVMPIEKFGSFSNAQHRVFMSATTQDDGFFVKILGVSVDSIKRPIINKKRKWSGEKMILVPELISDQFTRPVIIEALLKIKASFGIVALTPTWRKQEIYRDFGGVLIDKGNIVDEISKLQQGDFSKVLVLANRYDGIDLPDNTCRVLIVDSLPFFTNMNDKYEEKARRESNLIQKKLAQKIEQGLGRSVRGEKDYSCILVIGSELVAFIRSISTKALFSKQTQKQIEIGLQMAEWQKEEKEEVELGDLYSLMKQCLKRDLGWKQYYEEEMNSIEEEDQERELELEWLSLEHKAEELFMRKRYDEAAEMYQTIIDKTHCDESDKGWYLQKRAHCLYYCSKLESTKYQKIAFEKNFELLKPREGIVYKRLKNINLNRTKNIIDYIQGFPSYEELMLEINKLCESLSFGTEADRFEATVETLGKLLGYESQRPDKEIKKGPDNLWGLGNNSFVMIECKSEVSQNRKDIYKGEAGQMNTHCGWFEQEYSGAKVTRIMVIPTIYLAYDADFTHEVRVMNKEKLTILKKNLIGFFKELKEYDLKNLEDRFIYGCLELHSLNNEDIITRYTEKVKKRNQ